MRAIFGNVILSMFMLFEVSCAAKAPVAAAPPPQRELGMHLSGLGPWMPEVVFVDVFKQSNPWTSQAPGKGYNLGGPLAVNARGWVEKLNGNGHFAEALMFIDLEGHYPRGNYICLYDGDGEIEFAQAGKVVQRRPGRLVVRVTPKDGPIALRLTATDPQNPVRNIRLLLPGFERTYKDQPFYPPFLKRWENFKVLRFMDWGATNNSKVTTWAQRVTPDHATQAGPGGAAVEWQLRLANAQKADPWLCIPHKADDEYVREFAKVVKANLGPERKFYLEYSNECWHGGFEGGRYCAERGKALGLSQHPYEAELRYYSQRSVEIFKLVEEVLGSRERMVRVLTTPSDSAWAVGIVLDWNNAGKNVDAIAIAPYFGIDLGKPAQANKTAALSVDQLLDVCKKKIDEQAKHTAEIAQLLEKRGLKLLAYEGGQHLVGVEGAENNEKLAKLFEAANRDPRMKELYLHDLRRWQESGGGLFCVFASMGRYTRWGSWGVLEYEGQDEGNAPKLQAVREFMRNE